MAKKAELFEVNTFLEFFHQAKGLEKGTASRTYSNQQKLSIRGKFFLFRNRWGFTLSELPILIGFAYLHNPLHVEDLCEYGNIALYDQVAPHYRKWKEQNANVISNIGIRHALYKTAPVRNEVDDYLNSILEDFS